MPDRAVGGSEEKVDRNPVVAEGQQDAAKKQGAAVAKDQFFLGQDRGALRKRLAVLAHGLVQERHRPIGLSAKENTGVLAEGRAQVVEIGKIVVTRGVEEETGGPEALSH